MRHDAAGHKAESSHERKNPLIAKSNLKKVSLKSVGAVVASGALVAAMAVPAFAASPITELNGTDTKDVTVTFNDDAVTGSVYSVDVEWSGMDGYGYSVAADAVWNPSNHTYSNGSAGTWTTDDAGTVKVTNHSNEAVTAIAEFEANDLNTELTGTFSDGTDETETLETGVGLTYDTADSATFTLALNGDLATTGQVGTATVTISAAN